MKPYIVIATINELKNLEASREEFMENGAKVIIVDEGNAPMRARNARILQGINMEFYGPVERASWFKDRFGINSERYLQVIPERAHAETSFGFLVAFEQGADYVIELDDDVVPSGVIPGHSDNLFSNGGTTVASASKWYNTLESIRMSVPGTYFPRGHPYDPERRVESYSWKDEGGECVLNMGHWLGNPDFDAMTILYHGGMDGRCGIRGDELKREKVIVDKGTYFAICSMNTSFKREIIPAFYQLYMNVMGVDRFDDIWSGIFIKRIADHLGHKICLGKPAVIHDKRPRSVFKDLKKEIDGMVLNEILWKVADAEISGISYSDAYLSLADLLEKGMVSLQVEDYRRFMQLQVERMRLWVDIIDYLE